MPTYRDPEHGVQQSEALLEAAASAPITRPMLNCFELYHPIGTPDGPLYVANNGEDVIATKEPSAERDAGLTVTFVKGWIRLTRPEESDAAGSPETTLSVDNVAGEASIALRRARGSLEPWELIERVYAGDDLTGPAIVPPLRVLVTTIQVDGETVQLGASFGDPTNVAVPRTTFKRSEYPGLVR